jgi:protein tyrosine phosphatase
MAVVLSASSEFSKLELHDCDAQLCTVATNPRHVDKNRYGDIWAPDRTMVQVPRVDYINANYVDLGAGKQIIACQAPLPTTVSDFWNMVYYNRTKCILMLTRLIENCKPKSAEYWPHVGSTMRLGSFNIVNVRQFVPAEGSSIVISELLVDDQKVYHVYYPDWPDNGVADLDHVILLIGILLSFGLEAAVVHCAAGVGRSGIVCAILRAIYANETALEAVRSVRRDRHGCVQTKPQFRLVRDVVEYLR